MKNKNMVFEVDDFVMVGKKKIKLNLNVYRNLHYQVNNKAKINFRNKLMFDYPELLEIKANRINITYHIIRNTDQRFDTMNIISIVDKFFLDALVEIGCIPDDTYKYVFYDMIFVSSEPAREYKNKKIRIFCEFY